MRAIPDGIYAPIPTFFDAAAALDLVTLRQHIGWLSTFPLAGILALGSNGEAMHLTDEERITVIRTTRQAIEETQTAGNARGWRLLAGTSDFSTRGTSARCRAAAEAGADLAVVLPPFAFPAQMSPTALMGHYHAVADASPIPICIYNMPANAANIDMSAETILALATHPNIMGIKDSSGQIAKLAAIVAGTDGDFAVLAGSGSYLVPALSVGATGAIAAVANVIPAPMVDIFTRWQARYTVPAAMPPEQSERVAVTRQAQIIALNNLVTTTYGVAGLKAALMLARGYGGVPRLPLLPATEQMVEHIRRCYEAGQFEDGANNGRD